MRGQNRTPKKKLGGGGDRTIGKLRDKNAIN